MGYNQAVLSVYIRHFPCHDKLRIDLQPVKAELQYESAKSP